REGIPADERMAGLAKRMYAMVRKAAAPPRTSRATVVPRLSRSKSFTGSAAGDHGSFFAEDLRSAVSQGDPLAGVEREHAVPEAAAGHLGEQAAPGRSVLGAARVVGLEVDGDHRRGAE